MATNVWDETNPAGSRNRSLGDDDIRQFKLDVRERLAAEHVSGDGSAISASVFSEARHKLSSIGLLGLLKGLRIEQRTARVASGNITIRGKLQIEINGDMCFLNSDTSLVFSALTSSTSYYIYVASPGHETEIVAGNLSYSTTVPTYSTSKKGWYNGNLRAIGFFRTIGTNIMLSFAQTQGYYEYLDTTTGVLTSGSATTLTEITGISSLVPVFSGLLCMLQYQYYKGNYAGSALYFNESTHTYSVNRNIYPNTSFETIKNQVPVCLNTNRTVFYRVGDSTDTVSLSVLGFDLDSSL